MPGVTSFTIVLWSLTVNKSSINSSNNSTNNCPTIVIIIVSVLKAPLRREGHALQEHGMSGHRMMHAAINGRRSVAWGSRLQCLTYAGVLWTSGHGHAHLGTKILMRP
jgi:hypothetical protein